MKIILTQADFRTAISDFLAKQGINVNTDIADIDANDIEIDLNPEQATSATKPVQQRKRRTRAEIEADEAKAKMNPVHCDRLRLGFEACFSFRINQLVQLG